MTWFCTQNIPTVFRVQFLSFPDSTAEKFQSNFDDFLGPNTIGTGLEEVKLKIGPV